MARSLALVPGSVVLKLNSAQCLCLYVGLCLGLCAGLPPCAAQGLDFSFTLVDSTIEYDPATGQGSVVVPVMIQEHPINPTGFPHQVAGWSMSVRHDPALVDVTAVGQGAYVAALDNGAGPDFFSPNINLPNGFTIGCVYDFFGAVVCTYEVPKEAVVATYATVPGSFVGNSVGTTVDLEFFPLGSPQVEVLIVIGGTSIPVTANDGLLTVQPLITETFVRGDADGDLGISTIADVIVILGYLFNNQPLACLDTADVVDDGALNLGDPIYLLAYGFTMGPPPAAPFPSCGPDPTADTLGCASPPCP